MGVGSYFAFVDRMIGNGDVWKTMVHRFLVENVLHKGMLGWEV